MTQRNRSLYDLGRDSLSRYSEVHVYFGKHLGIALSPGAG